MLQTTLQTHNGMPLYNSSFTHGAVSMRQISLLIDACNNWGYDEG
jgi:hypothetical protein